MNFRQRIYKQIYGAFTGPWLITDIFWCNFYRHWLENILLTFSFFFLKNNLVLLMSYSTSKHENLKFIFDLENNDSFPFSGY